MRQLELTTHFQVFRSFAVAARGHTVLDDDKLSPTDPPGATLPQRDQEPVQLVDPTTMTLSLERRDEDIQSQSVVNIVVHALDATLSYDDLKLFLLTTIPLRCAWDRARIRRNKVSRPGDDSGSHGGGARLRSDSLSWSMALRDGGCVELIDDRKAVRPLFKLQVMALDVLGNARGTKNDRRCMSNVSLIPLNRFTFRTTSEGWKLDPTAHLRSI